MDCEKKEPPFIDNRHERRKRKSMGYSLGVERPSL
jgi:hypothetical protein